VLFFVDRVVAQEEKRTATIKTKRNVFMQKVFCFKIFEVMMQDVINGF